MKSQLFSPLSTRGLYLENRVVVSPMCQYSAEDGSATDWHLMHLGNLALSGAGLLIIEATGVEPRGRITNGCLGLYCDAKEAALARVIGFCRRHGAARIGIQLGHAGRKASAQRPWEGRGPLLPEDGAWEAIAPSPISGNSAGSGATTKQVRVWPAPRMLDRAGMDTVKQAFVAAAQRSERLGIDLIELHMAHGYLLHSFLSPLSNQRLVGYFQADTGMINQLVHIWKFADDADRRAHWAAVFANKDFVEGFAAKFRPLVISQEVKLMTAAPWGPHP